jgi:hypothetical protein
MSDGPFKSPLPKKCWQPVADRAANENYTVAEVQDAIPAALSAEFRELPADFKSKLQRILRDDSAPALIERSVIAELESIRQDAAGHPVAGLLLDCVEDAEQSGEKGTRALIGGTAAALDQCYSENARSIEEHAQRDQLGKAVTRAIRERLDHAALPEERLRDIAASLWNLSDTKVARTAPRREGLGDGPPIDEDSDE